MIPANISIATYTTFSGLDCLGIMIIVSYREKVRMTSRLMPEPAKSIRLFLCRTHLIDRLLVLLCSMAIVFPDQPVVSLNVAMTIAAPP